MILTIIFTILLVGGLSYALISASTYVAGIGTILDSIYTFLTTNIFGLLILLVAIIFIVYVIKNLDYKKIKFQRDYSNVSDKYASKTARLDYIQHRNAIRGGLNNGKRKNGKK